MNKSDFLNENKAEYSDSLPSLNIFYKIGLWIPIILSLIAGLIGIILIANSNFDQNTKIWDIIAIVFGVIAEIFLILVIQAIYRLNIYHLERINYNTRLICENLSEIVKSMNNKNEDKIENGDTVNSNNNVLEEDYVLATTGINQMLNLKLINDKQFDLYIKILDSLGEFKDSNKLIDLYKNKYLDLKNSSIKPKDTETQIIEKLNKLLSDKRITPEKYNEYSSILSNISKNQNEKEKQSQYKKLMMVLDLY